MKPFEGAQLCLSYADWFGPATENTASMTPFKGAYMHFFISFQAPANSTAGLELLSQLAGMLDGHVLSVFPYANLATDPNSGEIYPGAQPELVAAWHDLLQSFRFER